MENPFWVARQSKVKERKVMKFYVWFKMYGQGNNT